MDSSGCDCIYISFIFSLSRLVSLGTSLYFFSELEASSASQMAKELAGVVVFLFVLFFFDPALYSSNPEDYG